MAKVAFLFPGQGAQSVGMGGPLYDSLPAAKALFDHAAEMLGYSLIDICRNGPVDKLNSTVVSQPAIFVCSLAALENLRASDAEAESSCVAAAGLSLGEYTALVWAGAMSFADGLRLVQARGQAMQTASDATPSGMVSILGLEEEQIAQICGEARRLGTIEIANLLGPRNTVVSGVKAACEEVEKLAERRQALKTIRLTVAGAFHTDIMKPADQVLKEALKHVSLMPCRMPVWSNVDAQPHSQPGEIRDLLVRQVLQPVLWEKSVRNLLAAGVERFYEIGPGRVLAGLLKRIERKADCRNIAA